VQALDLMKAPPGSGLATRIAEFAWIVKNQARPSGYRRLGLPCHLLGTGMAFPWHVIGAASVASGHIVEDMKLGLDLARAGKPAEFCPEARVTSFFPTDGKAAGSQRRRWEHGHLGVILNEAPALLRDGLLRRDGALVALALDLCVPPLALLFLLIALLLAVTGPLALMGASLLPLAIAATAAAGLLLAVSLAWGRFGRDALSPLQLCGAVFYALWKIPLYLGFLLKRQTRWVRTRREAE
jgi:cellulose synthase/poly-beta-1,6-N-acetylglucosamine synthase-like glycosyltransferase